MLTLIKRLVYDENTAVQCIRAIVGAAGMLLITGVVTLDSLSATLGRAGWYVGIVLTICAWWVRAGDPTPPALRSLTPDQARELVGLVRTPPPSSP